ncbi:Zinc transporter 6-A [Toxocara canis]|uniref:Zinc transporter 6-A n=1 Tax=Toxocara canis TaxID=6265 RepID=A0A0B2V0I7_TOXCA|nr:Zinc transporter 6-A [Toxocara canis]
MGGISIEWSNGNVRHACLWAGVCAICTLLLLGIVSVTRSLVLTSAAWLSVFSFFSLVSTIVSLSVTHKPSASYSFGFARAPVLAVFSTTVLATLSSIFLIKESVEHLLESEQHSHPHRLYMVGALAASLSLEIAAYAVKNQPFQHVLTASSSSSLQEHFADVSHAICYVLPGLSVFLLPRLNAMSILAFLTTCACLVTHWFVADLWWMDAVAALVLSLCVFATMWPLSTYTGRILLQTSPPHVHNQLDRCMSEASTVDGVLELRSAHFWQLDFGSMAGTVDVRVRRDADEQRVLAAVTEKLSSVVSLLTVQVVKDAAASWRAHEAALPPNYYPPMIPQQITHSVSQPIFPPEHSNDHGDEHGHAHDVHVIHH